MFALAWNGLISERLFFPSFVLDQFFAWPLGAVCCSGWLLLNAQLHETGWRLVLTIIVMLINSVLWAWSIDWLWKQVSKRPTTQGFPVIRQDREEPRDGG